MKKRNHPSDRREFLQRSLLGTAGAGLAIAPSSETTVASEESAAANSEQQVVDEVDVLVVGGGTAGAVAAIQAGRSGVKTLLLEHNCQLGGTTTTAGVAFPGLFDAWGKQIIAGVGFGPDRQGAVDH